MVSMNVKAAGKHQIWTAPEAEVDEQTFTIYSWWEKEKEKEQGDREQESAPENKGHAEQNWSDIRSSWYNMPSATVKSLLKRPA